MKGLSILVLLLLTINCYFAQYVFTTQINSQFDDLYQNSQGIVIDSLPILEHKLGTVAAYRFQVDVPQSATINEAYLMLKYNWGTGPGVLEIFIENTTDAQPFSYDLFSLTNRQFLIDSVQYGVEGKSYSDPLVSADISNLMKKITEKAGWKKGNHIVLSVFNVDSNTSVESISYEGSPGQPGKFSAELFVSFSLSSNESASYQTASLPSYLLEPQITAFLEQETYFCLKEYQNSKKFPVIFSVDDLQAKYLEMVAYQIADLHLSENVDLLLNVIPNIIEQSALLQYTLEYWQKINPCLIEIGQHGFTHRGDQYSMHMLSYAKQRDIIENGLQSLKNVRLISKSFTPPAGRQNFFTFKILNDFGFHTMIDWYRKPSSLDTSGIFVFENLFLCEGSDGSIMGPECKLKSKTMIEKQLDEQIERLGYGCMSFHVQDFSIYNEQVDSSKISEYREILQYLKSTNKYDFMLPEEYYQKHVTK